MTEIRLSCVLLADSHKELSEGVRGLLETKFATVVMVADETSLIEASGRLRPDMVVVDISLSRHDGFELGAGGPGVLSRGQGDRP